MSASVFLGRCRVNPDNCTFVAPAVRGGAILPVAAFLNDTALYITISTGLGTPGIYNAETGELQWLLNMNTGMIAAFPDALWLGLWSGAAVLPQLFLLDVARGIPAAVADIYSDYGLDEIVPLFTDSEEKIYFASRARLCVLDTRRDLRVQCTAPTANNYVPTAAVADGCSIYTVRDDVIRRFA